jgi:hypothetical protein
MPLYQSVDPLPIEALDQVGDGIPALPTSSTGSGPKAGPIGDCEQFLSSCDLGGRSTMESARLLEGETFTRREGTQRVFLTTGHGKLQRGETLTTVHQTYSGRH